MRILGVRHHSPACAALVGKVIRQVRPARVLIEGPCDFNDRLAEFALAHQLPIALFSYRREDGCRSCWTPFCDYSPEWVALQAGREVGAELYFIDLPGWSRPFEERENRFSDRTGPDLTGMAQRLGFDDIDRLWDSLFEQPRPDLEEALRRYFQELRATLGEVNAQDREREQFMARYLAWSSQGASEGGPVDGGEVVVVCGGYHAPYLEQAWREADPSLPHLEPAADVGNFLVPFSFARLDSFRGYQSGMPSPGYHQRVWELGLREAARQSLQDVAQRLRARKQTASSADLIGAHSMAEGLARLRGHSQPARTDVLDGLATALLKQALEVDLPWSQRGFLLPGSDPMLVEIVAAFCGEREGRLSPDTPRPPLLHDVMDTLKRLDLLPSRPARRLELHMLNQRARSASLHRLNLLGIPGFQRISGPDSVTRQGLDEVWSLEDVFERESALIEASHYGPDLESAAARCLEEELNEVEGALGLAALLSAAIFADLGTLSARALAAIPQAVGREPELGPLGTALTLILEIYVHDRLLGGRGKSELKAGLEAGFRRGLWLLEGLLGEEMGALGAMVALRDLERVPSLDLERNMSRELMQRASGEPQRDPALRGAAVGYLGSLEVAPVVGVLVHFSSFPPAQAADFLVGLLALAREQVLDDSELVAGLDARVRDWTAEDFLVALPALRLAFSTLAPQEKERLGFILASLYGKTLERNWLRLTIEPELVARGQWLEDQLDRRLAELGLVDNEN